MSRRASPSKTAQRSASSKPIHGHLIAHRDGYGFVTPDGGGEDIYLSQAQMHTAMHGDYIAVWSSATGRKGKSNGVFHKILERSHETIVGRLQKADGRKAVIVPEDPRIHHDFEVAGSVHANGGDMVVADIVDFPQQSLPGKARIDRVLGSAEQNMDVELALTTFSLPHTWPGPVQEELSGLSGLEDESPRRDLTDIHFVTIDGADAKDFDDAVYAHRDERGWTLSVAIADVSHYVRPGSALDVEARKRGTSVYFPNRVVPMLPPELSEDLCSLRPDVERNTLVCEMRLGPDGELQSSSFYPARIRSRARLTYSVVDQATFQMEPAARQRLAEHLPVLDELKELYRSLYAQRQQRGALDFDNTECSFTFDSQGQVVGLHPMVRLESHRLIEECMVLANVATAEKLRQQKQPGLYRIHDKPQQEKLQTLRAMVASLGLPFPSRDPVTPRDCADLLHSVHATEQQTLVEQAVLRSQSLSVYSPDNIGHFGLALEHYTHFTSPIRRYSDLAVHRVIYRTLGDQEPSAPAPSHADMVSLGEHCSMAERRADEAVWDVEAACKCRLAEKHVGKHFGGTVNTVTQFGLFVELDGLYTEGLLHIKQMKRDYYNYEPDAQMLRGERTGETWQVGNRIDVTIKEVNLRGRRIVLVPRRGRA